MVVEILNALAALATIGGFLLEVFDRVKRLLERKSSRKRMTREEASITPSEKEEGLE